MCAIQMKLKCKGEISTMKDYIKKIITTVLLLLIIAAVPATIRAEEQKPTASEKKPTEQKQEEDKVTGQVDLSVLSAYIWRGYEQTRDSAVVQPAVTVSYKGFSVNVWGNLDTKPYFQGTADPNYASTWNETDYTLSYTRTMGLFNVGGGYIYYALGALNKDWPKRADAQELYLTVSLNTILSPSLTVYKELDHYRNWYFLFGVSQYSNIPVFQFPAGGLPTNFRSSRPHAPTRCSPRPRRCPSH